MKKTITVIKILGLFLFNYFVFYINNLPLLTCILLLIILIGIPIQYPLIKRLKTILPIACLIVVFQLLFNRSVSIDDRFFLGLFAAIRLIAISLSVLIFLTVTSFSELIQVFQFLPRNALLLFIMTCYFIPGVLIEGDKIKAVQKSRGMNINNIHIINNLASLIIPLLHRIFQRAETLALNMLARGYEE